MASSAATDRWYMDTAAAQIKFERLNKAEILNGRVAMLGFLIGVLTEVISGRGIINQITFGIFGCNWWLTFQLLFTSMQPSKAFGLMMLLFVCCIKRLVVFILRSRGIDLWRFPQKTCLWFSAVLPFLALLWISTRWPQHQLMSDDFNEYFLRSWALLLEICIELVYNYFVDLTDWRCD